MELGFGKNMMQKLKRSGLKIGEPSFFLKGRPHRHED